MANKYRKDFKLIKTEGEDRASLREKAQLGRSKMHTVLRDSQKTKWQIYKTEVLQLRDKKKCPNDRAGFCQENHRMYNLGMLGPVDRHARINSRSPFRFFEALMDQNQNNHIPDDERLMSPFENMRQQMTQNQQPALNIQAPGWFSHYPNNRLGTRPNVNLAPLPLNLNPLETGFYDDQQLMDAQEINDYYEEYLEEQALEDWHNAFDSEYLPGFERPYASDQDTEFEELEWGLGLEYNDYNDYDDEY